MSATQAVADRPDTAEATTYDAIIIGAGISGAASVFFGVEAIDYLPLRPSNTSPKSGWL